MMHGPINVKFPNNISKWQMGFNLVVKGLIPLDDLLLKVLYFYTKPVDGTLG
jgi:hypothetical protein